MSYSAVEIANEFLRIPNALGRLTQMQLQKLVFIANGFNLAINGQSLVKDTFQAWDFGPVEPNLRDHTHRHGENPLTELITDKDDGFGWLFSPNDNPKAYTAKVNNDEKAVIESVFDNYGHNNGIELSQKTHKQGTPWYKAYHGRGRNSPILDSDILAHYTELLENAV